MSNLTSSDYVEKAKYTIEEYDHDNSELELEKKCWLGLKLSPELRNRLYAYVKKAGGPIALWEMNKSYLVNIGLNQKLADSFISFKNTIDVDIEQEKLKNANISLITEQDEVYPQQLKDSPWHPGAIFVKGNPKQYSLGVAIVGSRRATAHGKNMAYELAHDLAKVGVAVVSGGARGIDSAAHRGAMDAGGPTYAVFGCGLNVLYPPENKTLFNCIENNWALYSEYPLDTPPLAHHFPIRNRIVAGMCDAVVVVEAGNKSGALITADFSLEFGREVFAVPGYSKSEVSKGTNNLIKQGACLVENAGDILEALGVKTKSKAVKNILKESEQEFLSSMGWDPVSIDDIMTETSQTVAKVSMMLVKLEIMGIIRKDITGCYLRLQ